ncbi:Aste57867_21818 [Aphanomyces stellatus]|uniref:Aste57867_21818 protein n=1 Tax=Aphanomyces stellatus TaxID=120398 RepID=A0A485LII2_9STRA|nr:hypothetical protein As57867_021749 [Aphanomyces stellatus]VFT98487.1 Aste57867_21818 [Aphanomyces stellatus]
METSFPRGKKAKGGEDASKKRKKPADSEVLFGKKDKHAGADEVTPTPTTDKPKGFKRPKAKASDDVAAAAKKDVVAKPAQAHVITFKTLRPQMLVMGVVRQINEDDVVISLPNKLNGVVPRKETSDELFAAKGGENSMSSLSDLFFVGQYVACVVLKASKEDKGKRIELSLRASLVNGHQNIQHIVKGSSFYVSVSSVEDHGVVVNMGIRGFTGFIPTKELHLPEGTTEAHVGQLLFAAVSSVNLHTNTATLTTDRAVAVKAITRGDSYTMGSLGLGMLLNVKVEEVLANGLQVNFLTFFSGTVEYNHMSNPCQKDWAAAYSKNMKGRARIVAIDATNKAVHLSMAPHIVHLQAPEFKEAIGDLVDAAVVHRIDTGIGMLLSLAGAASVGGDRLSWKDFRPAYAHISRCADTRVEKLDKLFKLDQVVPGRVIGHCAFDGIVNLTLAPAALDKAVLRQADLQPGQLIKGKVVSVESWGILVDICDGVRGLVSAAHAPAVATKKNMSKYKPGHSIECRVLKVDVASKKTHLTLKKGLVASELAPLTSYADAAPGTIAHGFVTKIAEFGVVVGFYNGVHGLVPAATLRKAGVEDIAAAYTSGQVVKVAVARCDAAKMRMTLTFDTSGTISKSVAASASTATDAAVAAGSIVRVSVVDVEDNFVRVQTTDGLEGVLQTVHLTDFPRLVDAAVPAVGDAVECLVLFQAKDGLLHLTKKPALLRHKANMPASFHDVKEGQLVTGFVRDVRPFGVFVAFLNNFQALAPIAFLTDRFVSSPDGLFEVGDTVQCVVDKVDAEKEQVMLDFRVKTTHATADGLDALLVHHATTHAPIAHTIGHTEKAEFVSAKGYGHVCTLADDSTVVVPETDGLEWTESDSVKLRLIDYDFDKQVYYGAATPSALVKAGEKKGRKAAPRLSKGDAVDATILLTRDEFAIVELKASAAIALLQVASFHAPAATCESLSLEVGQSHKCIVKGYASTAPYAELPVVVLAASGKTSKKKAKDPAQEHLPKYAGPDLVRGAKVTGRIVGIKEDAMEIKVKCSKSAGKINAFVSIADVDFDPTTAADGAHPFDAFSTNSVVTGRILAMMEKGANQRKPLSEDNPANFRSLNLSLRQADLANDGPVTVRPDWTGAGYDLLQSGKFLPGVVVETTKDGLMVRLSARVVGFLHVLELSKDISTLESFAQTFPVGAPLQVRVVSCDPEKKTLDLTCHKARELAAGDVVLGRVNLKVKALAAPSVMLQLGAHSFGRVCVTEVVDELTTLPLAGLTHGTFVQAVVLTKTPSLELSVKPSALTDPKAYVAKDKLTTAPPALGALVSGYVAAVTAGGCFVRLSRSQTARVLLRDLSDDFIKDPAAVFPPGTLVAGRVTKAENGKLELSLKASVVTEGAGQLTVESLTVGQTVKGTIKSIQAYGVFISLEKSSLSGLCHISEVADAKVKSLEGVFSVGDYVKAKILKVENRRISLGLKPSYFENDESSDEEEEDEDDDEEVEDVDMEAGDDDDEEQADVEQAEDEADDDDDEADDDGDDAMGQDDEEESDDEGEPVAAPQADFTWDGFSIDKPAAGGDDDDDADEGEDNEDDEASKSKLKRMKKKLKEHEDMYVAYRERALAAGDSVPESADDFERLLAVSPQNSFLWIQYMAFHVSQTDIAAARDVATRATTKISFRDVQEKFNVWVAFLNFEHDHGDEESFKRVFNSACRANDPKKVYLQLLEIYGRHDEVDDVKSTMKTMHKKFNTSAKVWLACLKWHMAAEDAAGARTLLQRSMQSLPKHKHLKVLTKFALMQYEFGEHEHGRTMFEQMVASYPKKMDLWNVYLDREIKYGAQESTRLLFERALALPLSAKKMKSLFKKYLSYEIDHGTDASVTHVQELAAAYVESSA